MTIRGLFRKEKPINGIIKYLNLEDFWMSCTEKEQADLIRYYQSGLSTGPIGSPIEGTITSSSNTVLKYFSSMLTWTTKEKNYSLSEKIINYGKHIPITTKNLLDAHFFYQEAAECYYKQREFNPDAVQHSMECCQIDVSIFPQYVPLMKKEYGSVPRILTFQRLIIIYENVGKIEDAIEICEIAIQYGLSDNTKGGYASRLEKLKTPL